MAEEITAQPANAVRPGVYRNVVSGEYLQVTQIRNGRIHWHLLNDAGVRGTAPLNAWGRMEFVDLAAKIPERSSYWYLNLCGGAYGDPPEPCCTVDDPCDAHLRSSLQALNAELDRTYARLNAIHHGAPSDENHDHTVGCCAVCLTNFVRAHQPDGKDESSNDELPF